jgi:hypothetical protein
MAMNQAQRQRQGRLLPGGFDLTAQRDLRYVLREFQAEK